MELSIKEALLKSPTLVWANIELLVYYNCIEDSTLEVQRA